jgi:ABC-type phosphate transport system substrate-binding protein
VTELNRSNGFERITFEETGMKFRIVIGGALLALAASQGALAYTPDGTVPDLTVLIGGASASENAVITEIKQNLCVGNTDVFDGVSQKAIFCDMSSASVPGLSGTLKVLVRKNSTGSGAGVKPVCEAPTGGTDAFAIFTTIGANANCQNLGSGNWSCPGNTGKTVTTEALIPQIGISDVKPTELFLNASTGCGANVFPSYEMPMNTPVSLQLRNALQEAQGLTVGSETEQNMPSLSTETVSAIMSGRLHTWNDVQINGVGLVNAVSAANGPSATPTAQPGNNARITICRRTDSSGTFATQGMRILQTGCVAGALAAQASNTALTDAAGPVVPAGLGSSDIMEQCLDTFSKTGVYAGRNGSRWAIGHNSLDRNPATSVAGQTDWRFIKLNGAAPTYVNVANGSYKMSVTSTIQWLSISGDTLAIGNALKSDMSKPDLLGLAGQAQSFGASGPLALAEKGYTVTYVGGLYDTANPVTPFSHNISATGLSNCIDAAMPSTNKSVPLQTSPFGF